LEVKLKNEDRLSDYLRKKQEVRLYLGYAKNTSYCFGGRIDAVKASYDEGGETVTLLCRDYSAPLIDTAYSIAYAERTSAQIAQMLATKYNLKTKIVPTTDVLKKELFQDRSEWEQLQSFAEREGYVCYIKKEKELVFAPRSEEDLVANLTWKGNVIRAEIEDSGVGIYNKVTVRHWTKKQKIEASAKDDFLIQQMRGIRERIIYDVSIKTPVQAKENAKKRLQELSRSVVTAEISVVGNPFLLAEKRVKILGFGRFSGIYYIERATHQYGTEGYITDLSLTNVRPQDAQQYRQDIYNNKEKKM
jgi:phage protein D